MTLDRGRAALIAAVIGFAAPAYAHHSFAMYDQAKLVTLNGTIKDFQWSNPHSVIFVLLGGAGRPDDLWTVELPTSPGNLSRMGWSKHSLKPGDKVNIDVHPLRDGHHGGSLKKVTLVATGEVLTASAPSAVPAPTR